MTPEQFVFWFQGFAEMTPQPPSAAQWKMMREHVASVFDKQTPPLVTEEGALPNRGARPKVYPRMRALRRGDFLDMQPVPPRDRIIC